MPGSLEHLRTFSQTACGLLAPHTMSNVLLRNPSEQRKGAERACSGAGCECVEHCESAKARSNAGLIIHVYGHPPMATNMNK